MSEPARNVPLIAKGDWVRQIDWWTITRAVDVSEDGIGATLDGKYGVWPPSRFTFLARPADPNDPEGWVAHDQSVKGPVDGMGLSMDFIMSDGRRYDGQKNPNFWHLVSKWRPHTPAPAGEGLHVPQTLPMPPYRFQGEAGPSISRGSTFDAPPSNGEKPSDAAKLLAYDDCHAVAVELGYPSMTEALEALSAYEEREARAREAIQDAIDAYVPWTGKTCKQERADAALQAALQSLKEAK